MVIRQTPDNKQDFVIVDDEVGYYLQLNGFSPKFVDNEALYFKREDDLIEFIDLHQDEIDKIMEGGEVLG